MNGIAGRQCGVRILVRKTQPNSGRLAYQPGRTNYSYCRYADDFVLGFTGPDTEAQRIKQQLAEFLQAQLKLELSQDKTLITHARYDMARFLGYDIHALHADDKQDHRGQRCINGSIGLRVATAGDLQPLCKIHAGG